MAGERVVLIDGSSLVFRAYFAIPASFTTAAGQPTNAIYGFALMFRKIFQARTPALGAVVFDPPGPSFRQEIYTEYKAQRPKMPDDLASQLPLIDRVVEAHDFPVLRVPGYEADDVIGTLCRQAIEAGHEVRLITSDKDFAQLIRPEVRMIDTMRDITYDEELVRKKWGVRPDQFVDLLAMMGDSSDNIPGVPGIGQKGGAQLLERFGTLDEVLAHAHELKGRQKKTLTENREQALLSRRLATIDQNVPLEVTVADLKVHPPDAAKTNALYKELEFYSLLEGDDARRPDGGDDDAAEVSACRSIADVDRAIANARKGTASVLVVHEQPSHITGALVGVALGVTDERARYIPLAGDGALGDEARERVRAYLEDPSATKVLHDLRDQWTSLMRHGIELRGATFDTALASFLIDPTGLIPHRLDQVAKQYLHRTLAPVKEITGSGRSEKALREVPLDDVARYAGHLAAAIRQLHPLLEAAAKEAGQEEILRDVSLPLALVLGRMQLTGIRVDPDDLKRMQKEFAEQKAEVEATIYALAGHEFNIGSTKQLADVLFEELKLPVIKKTKTGYSTAADVLERLAKEHEICARILRRRALDKLISTYTKVLRAAVVKDTGRIHATFQQTSGASGRLITTDPDLQRTPIRTEEGKRIRKAFIPEDGWEMISADWSQIELRVLAHVCRDERLLESFRDGVDVHRRTASELFDVAPDAVTSEQRNVGKTVNFATIYGQGATALGQGLGIPRKEAKRYIDRYFERYAGVRTWLDQTIAKAHEQGYVTTILGRRRHIPELKSRNFTDRSYGERVAANTPIQGSAADICKLAMLRIARDLAAGGLRTRMLLQIHDELVFESPPEELERACALIRDAMEHAYPLEVPLLVDLGTGASWADAH